MLREITCAVVGHRFRLAQALTDQAQRLHCTRCRRSYAVLLDSSLPAVRWDADFHRLYAHYGVDVIYHPWEFGRTP
ncbi:hypothetical protein J2T57_001468 [Natronocella acetinitrilica]|uniref:Uncharacterized protein n=1 Tax=Natronocella acetinitrilica TaxID=414046 RepID=A0AAE3G419_9GAMM|nr:hypothetical protein [Natronocella acetinitrilica]MCP1674366.1 hypothetical protein [Natronocella acetinitrilica]